MANENTHRMTGRSARAAWMLAALARRVALAQTVEDGQWRASTAPDLAQLPGSYLGTFPAAITTTATSIITCTHLIKSVIPIPAMIHIM